MVSLLQISLFFQAQDQLQYLELFAGAGEVSRHLSQERASLEHVCVMSL